MCSPFGDDYIYGLVPPAGVEEMDRFEWMHDSREIAGVGDYLEAVGVNYRSYSGRLSNFVCMIFTVGPHWLDKLVCGLAVFLMLGGMVYTGLSSGRRLRPWYVGLATVVMWVLFPWNNFMQSSSFVFNYPVTTVLVLLFIVLLRGVDGYGRAVKEGVIILAFVIGWIH